MSGQRAAQPKSRRVSAPPAPKSKGDDLSSFFWLKVGVPNIYRLVQGEANAIAPRKRLLLSMSPSIVSRNNQPMMVDAPRFHQQWQPEATNLARFAVSPDTQKLHEAMGHQFGAPQHRTGGRLLS